VASLLVELVVAAGNASISGAIEWNSAKAIAASTSSRLGGTTPSARV